MTVFRISAFGIKRTKVSNNITGSSSFCKHINVSHGTTKLAQDVQ